MRTPDTTPDRIDNSPLRGRRILILEDEMLVALETKSLMWRVGAVVVGPYARVHMALEAIQSQQIDAAVLDINVAGVHSYAVADALQARNTPFVFCTGYDRATLPPRFVAVAVVDKPLVPEVLLAALAEAMRSVAAQAGH